MGLPSPRLLSSPWGSQVSPHSQHILDPLSHSEFIRASYPGQELEKPLECVDLASFCGAQTPRKYCYKAAHWPLCNLAWPNLFNLLKPRTHSRTHSVMFIEHTFRLWNPLLENSRIFLILNWNMKSLRNG